MATSVVSPESGSASVGADLLGSVPADLFSSADVSDLGGDSPDSGVPEVETFDAGAPETDEAVGAELPTTVDPPAEEEAQSDDEPPPYEEAAAPADELPEGVRKGKDRNGKEGFWLKPNRYEQFHGAHQVIRDYEGVIGEPVTPQALVDRHRAFMGQERLYTDLASGDPVSQGKVLGHFFNELREAQKGGLVGTNPIVPLAQEFYKQVKADPDAYAHLRMQAAQDLINDMYQEAATSQNMNIWRSAGWIAKSLGLSYKPEAEMQNFARQQTDPLHQANARIQELQTQLDGRTASDSTAQYKSWQSMLAQTNAKALTDEALLPSITAEQRAAWEKFPTQFQNLVVAPLNRQVRDQMAKDAGFQERITLLGKQAERATSEQARSEIGGLIKQLFVNRARIAADSLKGPILKEAGALLKQQNQQTHQRRQAAENQRSPQGSRAQVPRSLIPSSMAPSNRAGTTFTMHDAMQDMQRLIGG